MKLFELKDSHKIGVVVLCLQNSGHRKKTANSS